MRRAVLAPSIILLALFASVPSTVLAQGSSSQNEWKWGAEIYLWGASVDGETPSGGDVEVSFGDLVSDVKMGFMGIIGARKGKWSLLADVLYLDAEDEGTIEGLDASAELRAWVVTPDVGYRLSAGNGGHLDLHAGVRFLSLDGDVRLGPEGVGDSDQLWDAIAGFRGRLNFTDRFYLPFYFDIGAGQSEKTWQALAGLGYHFKHVDVVGGYRYLDYSFDDNLVFDNLNLSGPYLGIKFAL